MHVFIRVGLNHLCVIRAIIAPWSVPCLTLTHWCESHMFHMTSIASFVILRSVSRSNVELKVARYLSPSAVFTSAHERKGVQCLHLVPPFPTARLTLDSISATRSTNKVMKLQKPRAQNPPQLTNKWSHYIFGEIIVSVRPVAMCNIRTWTVDNNKNVQQ